MNGRNEVSSSRFVKPAGNVDKVGHKTWDLALEDGGVATQDICFIHVGAVGLRHDCKGGS